MVDLTKLDELIARVEKATAGDRAIDCLLGDLEGLASEGQHWSDIMAHGMPFAVSLASRYQSVWFTALPYYLTSIDAATGLAERMMPEKSSWWDILKGGMELLAWDGAYSRERRKPGDLPRFVILALLKALRESSERGR